MLCRWFMQQRLCIRTLITTLLMCAAISEPARADLFHGFTLPDSGPRYEAVREGPDASVFTQGTTAFRQSRYSDAEQAFSTLLRDFPASRLLDASRAFLADILATGGTEHHRRLAVEAYRALIRQDPASANASRARWRIGDLYAGGRWLIEAKASYEQALADSPDEAARALLGLGLVSLEEAQWKDAERALQQVRTKTEDDALLGPATFGLAEALARAEQWEKAQALYEAGARRWPAEFKRHPESILLAADVKGRLQQHADVRVLLEQFYNLYPGHAAAASALVRIADSWRHAGRSDRAQTLYAAVIQQYPATFEESVARMRLAELGRERFLQNPRPGPQLGIEAILEGRPAIEVDVRAQQEMFEHIAEAYASVELGSEALFHLGEHLEALDRRLEAVQAYRRLSDRKGLIADDPWPEAGGQRLVAILSPWIQAALHAHDDLAAVNVFYRHGALGEELYAGQELLLQLADAHHRLGFSPQAVKLYQILIRERSPDILREKALVGLGHTYFEQQDFPAARRVFERVLLQYPTGPSRALALRQLAETLQRQGDWNGVIRVCRLWLRRADTRPSQERQRMLYLLASAQVEIGQPQQALETLARSAAAAATPNGAWLRYADQLFHAGQYDQAASRYTQGLQTVSSQADAEWARFQLAKIRRAQKRYSDARLLLQEVQAMTTDDLIARISAALLADLPRTTRAGG